MFARGGGGAHKGPKKLTYSISYRLWAIWKLEKYFELAVQIFLFYAFEPKSNLKQMLDIPKNVKVACQIKTGMNLKLILQHPIFLLLDPDAGK